MTSDSDARLDLAKEVADAAAEMKRQFPNSSRYLLTGSAKVQLVVTAEDVATPIEAVQVAVRDLFMRGLDAFVFAVTDTETGDHFLVRGGQMLTLAEARAEEEEEDEPDGDEG